LRGRDGATGAKKMGRVKLQMTPRDATNLVKKRSMPGKKSETIGRGFLGADFWEKGQG